MSASLPTTEARTRGSLPAPLADFGRQASLWWRARLPRERQALILVGAVLAFFVVWSFLVQPALRTVQEAPAELDRLDAEWQQTQRTAAESQRLRGTAPVPASQVVLALKSATDRLGDRGRLTQRGDRATLTLSNVSPEALRGWLSEARSGARARPLEAQLQRASDGYSGSLSVSIGNPP